MAPSSKWSTARLMARNYTGVSASAQLSSFQRAEQRGGSSTSSGSTEPFVPDGIDASAPWYSVREDQNGTKHLYCHLCKACVDEWHVKTDKHKNRESDPSWYGDWKVPADSNSQLVPTEPQVVLEEWQELRDNEIRCKCCDKAFDEAHADSKNHKKKLDAWLWERKAKEEGLPPPPQPWLCYKVDPKAEPGYENVLSLHCLMCKKWVDDWELEDISNYEGAHGFESSQNAREHTRKLANLESPEAEEWWQERLMWHPPLALGNEPSSEEEEEGSASTTAADENEVEEVVFGLQNDNNDLPPGWHVANDEDGDPYYYHDDGRNQWVRPGAGNADSSAEEVASASAAAGAEVVARRETDNNNNNNHLLPGWHVAYDEVGDPYYYHDDGRSQWDAPLNTTD
uniref:Nuclear protein EMA1 n=1 Tax=Crypthecodinium cohnii TaxID=2866 RepID=O22014_CRYCO|nr:nuclear protein EMA1 [Crypthecodinium cohnii]